MSKKITILIQSLRGGGAERVCVSLCDGFVKSGYDVELIVLDLKNAVLLQDLNPAVRVVHLGAKRARYSLLALASFIKREKPESLLVFNYHLVLLLVLLRMLLCFKTKIIARTISTLSMRHKHDSFWRGNMLHFLTKCFYPKADAIIAQSEGMKRDLVTYFNLRPEQVKVIYNPVNSTIESHVSTNFPKSESKNYLLCVGRLEKVKAFDFAIKAFARLKETDIRLKIIGKGSQEGALKKLARDLGVANSVDFEGYQGDLISYYKTAKATLLTSLYEGFPNVLVESVSLGTPIIAFDCQSGPSEIIQDDVNGYLVRYQHVDHLAACMSKTLSKDWDEAAIRGTASRYASALIVRQYIDTIQAVNHA